MIHIGYPTIVRTKDAARMRATVSHCGNDTTLFFEVAPEYADCLCCRADAFVVALLPFAMRMGQDIVCEAPLSARLLSCLTEYLMPNLDRSTNRYQAVEIFAELAEEAVPTRGAVGTGYSGGADSLYAVHTHLNRQDSYRLTHLAVMNVGSFEGEGARDLYKEALKRARRAAAELGLEVVGVDSNLHEALNELFLSAGHYRLAAAALALQGLWKCYLIASSWEFSRFVIAEDQTDYYAALLTHCVSTETLAFYSAGAEARRVDKLRALADWPFARRNLSVCVRDFSGKNCGACGKCVRTEAALWAMGLLERFDAVFDVPAILKNMDAIWADVLFHQNSQHYGEALLELRQSGREPSQASRAMARRIAAAGAVADRRKNRVAIAKSFTKRENAMFDLSFIVPAYNAEKYIEAALRSIAGAADGLSYEILVCDDGSTDATAEIAKRLGAKVLSLPHGGAAKARNAGIREAVGAHIALLDADDLYTERAVVRMLAALRENHVEAVFARAEDFLSPELSEEEAAGLQKRPESYGGVLPGCSLFRREVFEKVGLFEESLQTGETVSWQLRLRDARLPSHSMEFVSLKRRLHLSNTGRRNRKQEMRDYSAILRERMRRR